MLEEYLTEAGLRALDADENDQDADATPVNFAELALLLQQSANIYGRKVNYLYQSVLLVRDSLHNSTMSVSLLRFLAAAQSRHRSSESGL